MSLDRDWKQYVASNSKACEGNYGESEQVHYLGALVHSLMQRLFLEEWSKEEFVDHYSLYVKWIIGGIGR